MRILAVRGENLASLAEPFAVDFTVEPLLGAGLFAITGETGAGKSTLLDAVCLALYGEFPRIAAEGGRETLPDVDGETIGVRDPRSILRRGAAHASAEVDFVAVDGSLCRARWSVARARGRASGRLQKVSRVLERLGSDGVATETLADKVSEVAERVVELTDLTSEQFRRTVLLAQGDFDAFLRAGDAERADLLEKITGTAVYARLSVAAFERAKAARDRVERLRAARDAVGHLAPDARAERVGRRDALLERRARLDGDVAEREAVVVALRARAAAEERLAAARAAEDAARAAHDAAAPERDTLAEIDRARALAPVFERLAHTRDAEARAVEAWNEVDRRLAETTPAYERAGNARRAAHDALARADERIARLKPDWDAAARLDERILAAAREVADAEEPRATAVATRDFEAERIAGLERRRGEVAHEIGRLGAELDRLATFAPLAPRWEEIAARLDERARAHAAAAAAEARRVDAHGRAAAARARLAALDDDARTAAARRDALAARLDDRRALAAALDTAALRARDGDLDRLASDLARLDAPIDRLADARAAWTLADAALAAAAAESTDLGAERAEVAAALDADRARLAAGALAARLAEAVASAEAEHLRAHLVDGEPCPVCGARDHPIAADPAVRAALDALARDRADLAARAEAEAARLTDIDGRRAAATARVEEATRRRAEAETLGRDARARLDRDLADADARAAILELAVDPAVADPAERRDALAAHVAAARALAAEALGRAVDLAREIDDLRAEIERLDREREAARAARADDEAALAAARLDEAAAAEAESAARARRADCDAHLADVLARLDLTPADLDRDAPALRAHLAAAVADHRRLSAAHAHLIEEERALERDVLTAHAVLERAELAVAAAGANLDARRDALARLEIERAPMLDGRPTAEHRAEIETARAAAALVLADAAADHDAARSAHETALAQRGERHAALLAAQDDSIERARERDHALAAADLHLADAARLLARPQAEVEALRARLADLDHRLTGARAAAAARLIDLAALARDDAPAPDLALDPLIAAIDAARAEIGALDREIGALDGELALDDAARTRAGDIGAEIAAAEADAAVDAAVDEAIGSAGGDKFRRIAQGFTLDRLCALAGRHLATLNPRYRLARTEGLGLAIVDRDMGEEMRSTRSLSGGERFLASLALALALSGLEGRRSFVDTLFIDEGFGSLDAATLDVAIDALESLQSEGRKVGVISHVAAMQERIPVRIAVERAGLGRSRIAVRG